MADKRACPVCGIAFKPPHTWNRCCSKRCAGLLRRARIVCSCDECGKVIEINRAQFGKSKHHFCSTACSHRYMARDPAFAAAISRACRGRKPWNKGKTTGQRPWNTGLTKETDSRLAAYGRKCSSTKKGKTLEELCGPEKAGDLRRLRSMRFRREGNPAYKDGSRIYRQIGLEAHGARCDICGGTSALLVHHRDFDRRNPDLANLQVLCNGCHQRLHNVARKESLVNEAPASVAE